MNTARLKANFVMCSLISFIVGFCIFVTQHKNLLEKLGIICMLPLGVTMLCFIYVGLCELFGVE